MSPEEAELRKIREPNYPCPKSAFPLSVTIKSHGNFGYCFVVYPNCTIMRGHANEIADTIEDLIKVKENNPINEKDIEFLMAVWGFSDTLAKKRLDEIIIKLQKQLGIKPLEALP